MEEESESESIVKQANISLVLNSYNDIFSSFDPRPYSEKALSDDFLEECKRAVRDKDNSIELRLMIPKAKRNLKEESKIRKRLHEHFHHHFSLEENRLKKMKGEGVIWTISGMIILAGILFSNLKLADSIGGSLILLLEVPSWFLIWEGMDKIFITAKDHTENFEFYDKMTRVEINFVDY